MVWVGGLLVLPSALFVAANVLKHELGIPALADRLGWFAEPGDIGATGVTAVVLFGPVLALIVVLVPIVRLRMSRSNGELEAAVALRVRAANLAVAAVAFAVLALLAGYLFSENASCWFGSSVRC